MKLETEKGELELPKDFAIEISKTNPMFSDEGDTSYPVTLPASTRNLAACGHRERIDSANTLPEKASSILTIGSYQKHGKIVYDSAHKEEGVCAVFAFDNSDLYTSYKSKTLKEIFAEYNNGNGYKRVFRDLAQAMLEMEHIYGGDSPIDDYTVFPVAVAAYKKEEKTIYQFNNEIDDYGRLVYKKRVVHEDSGLTSVPEGYGVAPFLLLHRMIHLLFTCMGYTVVENVFSENPWNAIAVVHNCSDALVLPVLQYKDLVPSCTLSEFLEWLEAKFHVFVVADSDNKEVRVKAAEATLKSGPYSDITGMREGEIKVRRAPSSHVVLTPNNSLDGTEPAANTKDELIQRYQYVMPVNEAEFYYLTNQNAPIYSYVFLRKSTGVYYEQCLDLSTGKSVLRKAGTNYFTYDDDKAESSESYGPTDVIPLMLCDEKCFVAPYIGERIHFHTALKNKDEKKEKQDIIIVQYYNSSDTAFKTTGTTQNVVPRKNGQEIDLPFGLTTDNLFTDWWEKYNDLLLNGKATVNVKLKLGHSEYCKFPMDRIAMMDGQPLLPVKLTTVLSERIKPSEAEFILVKQFNDGVTSHRATATQHSTFPDITWWFDIQQDVETAAASLAPGYEIANAIPTFHNKQLYIYPPPEREESREIDVMADIYARVEDPQSGVSHMQTFTNCVVTLHLRGR